MEENISVARRRKKESGFFHSPAAHFALKALLGIIVVLVVLTLIQCSIEKPAAPTFTTHLTVPLVNRTYSIREIIDKIDQPGLSIDSAGDVLFSINQELDTIRIGDNLDINDISEHISESLGQLSLSPNLPDPIAINLGEYFALDLGMIPAVSFDIQKDVQPFDNFNWVEIVSGGLDFIIVNNFGVDLDTVIFQLYDIGYSRLLSTVPLPPPGIPEGETDTVHVDLGGRTISNNLQINIHCHTPGGAVLSLADKSMTASVDCPEALVIAAAQAVIPAIEKSFGSEVELSESNTIISAEISRGEARIRIQNSTALEGTIRISLPDFKTGGQPYTISRTIHASSTDSFNVVLDGFIFEPLDQTRPQVVSVQATALLDSSGSSFVTVHQSDSVTLEIEMSGLKFRALTGIIDSTEAAFDSIATAIDLPKGFDSLQLTNAELILEIENGINFAGNLNIEISGNQGKTLPLQGFIAAGSPNSPVLSIIANSNLAEFLNPVPSEITVSGAVTFGDGNTSGTISADDFIVSRVRISSPLEVVIGRSVFEGDISSEKISQEDIGKITNHVMQADFNSTIINHLPLGVSVEIFLSGDSATLYTNPELTLGPVDVSAGLIGPNGEVISPTESENLISIDSLDIKILENPILYSGQIITLAGSNGQTIKITGDDYVTARGVIQVQYKFDGKF